MFNSITKKLFLLLFISTLLLSAVYTFFIVVIAYVTEDTLLERILDVEAEKLIMVNSQPDLSYSLPSYLKYYESELELPKVIQREVAIAPNRQEVFAKDGSHYHIKHIYHGNNNFGILVAEVTDLLVVSALAKELVYLFIGLAFIMLFFVSILAYQLAKYIAYPIKSLASGVKSFSPNLNISKELRIRNDEIGFLAQQLQVSMSELTDALNRERYFTADISHELRTPLTYISNKVQTINLTAEDKEELLRSINEVDQIVTVLLTLARSESLVTEPIQLTKHVEQAVLNLHNEIIRNNTKVELNIDPCMFIEVNAQLFSLILKNIIENAVVHSEGENTIKVDVVNEQVIFTNDIPVKSELLESDYYGFGHGTHLITKLSEAAKLTYCHTISKQKYTVVLSIPPQLISFKRQQ